MKSFHIVIFVCESTPVHLRTVKAVRFYRHEQVENLVHSWTSNDFHSHEITYHTNLTRQHSTVTKNAGGGSLQFALVLYVSDRCFRRIVSNFYLPFFSSTSILCLFLNILFLRVQSILNAILVRTVTRCYRSSISHLNYDGSGYCIMHRSA